MFRLAFLPRLHYGYNSRFFIDLNDIPLRVSSLPKKSAFLRLHLLLPTARAGWRSLPQNELSFTSCPSMQVIAFAGQSLLERWVGVARPTGLAGVTERPE
jgi:hypothetical protein